MIIKGLNFLNWLNLNCLMQAESFGIFLVTLFDRLFWRVL